MIPGWSSERDHAPCQSPDIPTRSGCEFRQRGAHCGVELDELCRAGIRPHHDQVPAGTGIATGHDTPEDLAQLPTQPIADNSATDPA
jgi:hypothetical protein